MCRSQWPRGLRRRSADDRLLRSWVRIPPRAWMFVCCEFCVLSRRGLWDEMITRPEESYWLCCVVVCDLETSRMRRPWPALGRSATAKVNVTYTNNWRGLYTVKVAGGGGQMRAATKRTETLQEYIDKVLCKQAATRLLLAYVSVCRMWLMRHRELWSAQSDMSKEWQIKKKHVNGILKILEVKRRRGNYTYLDW